VGSSPPIQALVQQLLTCHATMRQQQQRIDDLEEELSQCRKREEAGQEMFLQLFGENQKICAERRRLDAKEARIKKIFEDVRSDKEELGEAQACLEHDKMLFQAIHDSLAQLDTSNIKDSISVDEKREVGEINPFSVGMTSKQFRDKDLSRWNLKGAHRAKIVGLRYRHEYYRGWLDAMRSEDDKEAFWMLKHGMKREITWRPDEILRHMYEKTNPKHPFTVGFNAGLLFGWSTLCRLHSLPQHDIRLDSRKWHLGDLIRQANQRTTHSEFWKGMYEATEKMQQLFTRKLRSGV
jgi:hypothetical protein